MSDKDEIMGDLMEGLKEMGKNNKIHDKLQEVLNDYLSYWDGVRNGRIRRETKEEQLERLFGECLTGKDVEGNIKKIQWYVNEAVKRGFLIVKRDRYRPNEEFPKVLLAYFVHELSVKIKLAKGYNGKQYALWKPFGWLFNVDGESLRNLYKSYCDDKGGEFEQKDRGMVDEILSSDYEETHTK